MSLIIGALVLCQAIGALGGALWAVWGELAYAGAARDGNIDAAEQAHLRSIARGLKYGMTLLLAASLGLIVSAYVVRAPLQPALTASFWAFISLALAVIAITWGLSRKKLPYALGSAALLAAWWYLAYASFAQVPSLTYTATVIVYAVATLVLYVVLRYARKLMLRGTPTQAA